MTGIADYYDLVRSGSWDLKRRKTSGYRTRLLVRFPGAAAFNGAVVVDWMNVTMQADLDSEWLSESDVLAGAGFAYVGVTVQRYGSEHLVRWDPKRYAGMRIWDEGLGYEIYSQAARVVRERSAEIFDGLDVQHVIGAGASQSAWRLTTYVNAFHPRDHVFDGFILRGRGRGGTPLRGDGITNGPRPAPIRSDIDVPVIVVQSEGDLIGLQSLYERQDDGPNFRLWEVAGAAHGGADAAGLCPSRGNGRNNPRTDVGQRRSQLSPQRMRQRHGPSRPASMDHDRRGTALCTTHRAVPRPR
jgi:hypothetical protein